MKLIKLLSFACGLVLSGVLTSYSNSGKLKLTSPDGKIVVELTEKTETSLNVNYKVSLNGKEVIAASPLGICLFAEGQRFSENLKLVNVEEKKIDETYTMPVGKTSVCMNKANEKIFVFENKSGKKINIIFRAYNDGVAFRYQLFNDKKDSIKEEVSSFYLNQESNTWAQKPIFDYQGTYDKQKVKDLNSPSFNLPALFETPDKIWMLLSDAAVFGNYAACEFTHQGDGKLKIYLPNQPPVDIVTPETGRIIASPNLLTPWRAMIIGAELKTIVESTLILNLNPPCEIKDLSWIKPGVAAFPWWYNFFANDSKEDMYKFVDMAADLGWQYVEFDIGLMGYDGWRTSQNWKKVKYIPEVIDYAKSKGVSIYGWDERRATDTPAEREDILGSYVKLGIKGIKDDYFNSDKQECMIDMENIVRDAANRKLLVSFHGCIAPKGMQRTFPNIMSYEGVRGGEYYKIDPNWRPNPVHNNTLPYTRNAVGSMDFTPCSFSMSESTIRWDHDRSADILAHSENIDSLKQILSEIKKDPKYKNGWINIYPGRTSTYAHELALPFIFESGWMCMADGPEWYSNSSAKPLLKKIHANWDEIKFIGGYPGDFTCLARRSGNDWFVAAINAVEDKNIEINFDFISDGDHQAILYTDGQKPLTEMKTEQMTIKKGDKKNVSLKHNGGFVLYIPGK